MKKPDALVIEMWPIQRVLAYAGNAKQHPDIQVGQLATSIKQFGFVNPVLVDATGVLIAGHGRILAANKLGLKKVPVIQLGYLSDTEAKALRLADNVIPSRSVWSPELVEVELASLKGDYPAVDLWGSRFYSRLRQGGVLLILIFVIGVFNRNEASAGPRFNEQFSAERGGSNIIRAVPIVDVPNAVEARQIASDSHYIIERNGLNEVWERAADAGLQHRIYWPSECVRMFGRERIPTANEQKIHAVINETSIRRAGVDANSLYPERQIGPELVHKPNMLDANFGAMRCEKFLAGKPELVLARSPEENSSDTESDGRKRQHASEGYQPKSEIGDGIIRRLFPKPVLYIFFGSFFGTGLLFGAFFWWASMGMERRPVDSATCTVNGSHFSAGSTVWAGLKMEDAEPRYQSTMFLAICGQKDAPLDIHLDVPWCHPSDRTGNDDEDFDCRYRVRPKMQPGKKWKGKTFNHIAFERWNGKWFLALSAL